MSKRASLLAQIAGVIAIIAGLYVAWGSWVSVAAANPSAPGLLDYADPAKGVAFADSLTSTLSHSLALPRMLATEPLIWFGLALVLVTKLHRRITQQVIARDPANVGYSYAECLGCRSLVPVNSRRCPLCGAQLSSPWSTVSKPGLGTSGQRG